MTKVWKIAPGEHAEDWRVFREKGCIGLGWLELPDYRNFRNKDEVLLALEQEHGKNKKGAGTGAAEMIWRFLREIEPSDTVVANEGYSRVVGIGSVESEYLAPTSRQNPMRDDETTHRHHVRRVDWRIKKPVDLPGNRFFVQPALWPLKTAQVEQIRRAYLKAYPDDSGLKEQLDRLFGGVLANGVEDPTTNKLLAAAEQQLAKADAFQPAGIKDARERTLASIVRRRGQPAFRKHLLAAYGGRCAITGCQVEAILEAAHITPYKGSKTNRPGNGLLLRADLHTLFDLRLVAVNEATMRVVVSPKLAGTEYEQYRGQRIRLPDDPASRPSPAALKQHRQKSRVRS